MSTKQPIPKPPNYLSAAAKKWWKKTAEEFVLESHHLKILELAAGEWDRAEQARNILSKDGLTIKDRFGQVKAHPAAAIERDSKALFYRLVRELGLDIDSPTDSRPPRLGGARW